MNRILGLCVLFVIGSCSALFAYTLSFDDIPPGGDLQYYSEQYGIAFSPGFLVADHTGYSWGLPHSGAKVLTWTADSTHTAKITFGRGRLSSDNAVPGVRSLSGYFSTASGTVVRMVAYGGDSTVQLAAAEIGSTEEAWSNQYVELSSGDCDIEYVVIEGVNSADARLGFCTDDISIVPAQQ